MLKRGFLVIVMSLLSVSHANTLINNNSNVKSKEELEWGTVLFEYFQDDYFNSLIEHEYNQAARNRVATSGEGQLLKGGMQLSYGLADDARTLFQRLLSSKASEADKNRAWFYLSKLYYHKSEHKKAAQAFSKIRGKIPKDIYYEFHYRASLVQNRRPYNRNLEKIVKSAEPSNFYYPYLMYNLGIARLGSKNIKGAMASLTEVTKFASRGEEFAILSDRARHGLSLLAIEDGKVNVAWEHLTQIRTTGLYSNRALLTYAWSAIKLKQFSAAIPALKILDERSITIPEVQEAKVLLAHLFEQEGSPRKALKSNLLAIKDFERGIGMIQESRKIIARKNVPREYIENLQVMMEDTDWYGTKPALSYRRLTPFLIDLLSSNIFNETLRELSDLYAMQKNLEYWLFQANEHLVVLREAERKDFNQEKRKILARIDSFKDRLARQSRVIKLNALTLPVKDQKRLSALVQNTNQDIQLMKSKIDRLKKTRRAYQQPTHYKLEVAKRHANIKAKLDQTLRYIAVLEPLIRSLIYAELKKHEERMRYYWAQSRLAKARLYDTELMKLENAQQESEGP